MNPWRLVNPVLLLLGFANCAGLPHPSHLDVARAQQRYPDATLASLESGRTTYAQRCAGCHSLRSPQSYQAGEWEKHLEKMAGEAGLSFGERQLVAEFLITMSAGSQTNR
jgi:mono/diheme cytochrome c family protein